MIKKLEKKETLRDAYEAYPRRVDIHCPTCGHIMPHYLKGLEGGKALWYECVRCHNIPDGTREIIMDECPNCKRERPFYWPDGTYTCTFCGHHE